MYQGVKKCYIIVDPTAKVTNSYSMVPGDTTERVHSHVMSCYLGLVISRGGEVRLPLNG